MVVIMFSAIRPWGGSAFFEGLAWPVFSVLWIAPGMLRQAQQPGVIDTCLPAGRFDPFRAMH